MRRLPAMRIGAIMADGRAKDRMVAAAETFALAVVLSAVFPRRTRPRTDRAPGAARDAAPSDVVAPGRGHDADRPDAIPPSGWWDIAKRIYREVERDRILAVAAGVTFYGLLAIFPAIAAFVSLYGLVADPGTIADQLNAAAGVLPGGAIEIIGGQVRRITGGSGSALGFAFFSGLAVSLWSANSGVKAVFDALNVAYEETERRSFLVLNATSLAFTFGAIALLALLMGSVVVVPIVLRFFGAGGAADWLIWILRWPVLLGALLTALALLYRFGPSRERARWRWLAPGSLVGAGGWIVFSMLFSWYVSSFGTYNETYGSLGAAIGFMTWLWLSTVIVLVGAEMNAETEHQTARDTTTGPARPRGDRGARMADRVAPEGP